MTDTKLIAQNLRDNPDEGKRDVQKLIQSLLPQGWEAYDTKRSLCQPNAFYTLVLRDDGERWSKVPIVYQELDQLGIDRICEIVRSRIYEQGIL